ncbi:MAG TPA: class I SAM-dependent methyltransferase [Miltoncostaeaceae bacterium]|nr:class I SAM-dependent methyltransferase [Miltoncostaeaceae bacterium]
MATTTDGAPGGFSRAAASYDDAVRHNIAGSRRLVMSLPDGDHARVLDVGCGTGFTSMEMLRRFDVTTLVGVDPAEGMLDVFAAKLAAFPAVEVDLRAEGVMEMEVEDGGFDTVISAMALHWFPDKPAAVARMARALRPGGLMGVLTAGRGGEDAWREVLERVGAPPAWTGWFAHNQRDVDEIAADMRAAGLEPLDVWMERRRRATPPEAFMARTRAVAGHLLANPPGGFSDLDRRIEAGLHSAAGPDGFVYDYCKLFAVARRPASRTIARGGTWMRRTRRDPRRPSSSTGGSPSWGTGAGRPWRGCARSCGRPIRTRSGSGGGSPPGRTAGSSAPGRRTETR